MEMQPAPLCLSWVGNSCLCQKDAERELIALRGKPIMQTGVLKPAGGVLELSGVLKSTARSGGGGEKASGGRHRRRRSSHPPSNNTTTLPEKKKYLTPSTKLTSDEAIVKIQEETEALRQALADKSDYRLAQCSMNRLDDLESALWEAHATETRAAAQLETLELQREQKAEEEALEADLKEKVDRLRVACGQRAFVLRREHAAQLDELGRAARSGSGGGGGGGGASAKKAKKAGPPAPCAAQLIQAPTAATLSLVSLHQQQQKRNTETNHTTAEEEHEQAEQNQKQEQEQEQEREEEGGAICSARQPTPLVAVTVAEASVPAPVLVPVLEPGVGAGVAKHARKKEMVDLRDELGRHLAVAHADGGQHLKEATRVMRLIEEVEAQARLEAEAKANSKHDSLEILSLRQKHAQAEDVQQDKHERLLRSLERSRAEQLRLVSARHNGALGRLTERRREKDRRRKQALREQLAAAKGGVARAWKEHNRCLLGAGRGSKKRRAARENGELLGKYATAAAVEAAAAAAAAGGAIEVVAAPERGSELTSMELAASKMGRCGDRSATHSSCLVGITARAAAGAEAAVGVGNQVKANASKTLIEHTAPSMVVEQVASWEKSVETKQQSRREATLSPTATTTFPTGSSSNNNRGPARRQQRKRRVTSDTHNNDARELPTTSPTLATAFVGGAVGVLSEEEVQALAALGRGTPNDPRLLLVASRPPPPPFEVGAIDVPREKRGAMRTARDDFGLKTSYHTLRMARDDCGKDSYYHSDGGGRAVGTIRGRGRSVLERAVDKLVPEMRARENLTRRSFGMASLAPW